MYQPKKVFETIGKSLMQENTINSSSASVNLNKNTWKLKIDIFNLELIELSYKSLNANFAQIASVATH